MMQISEVGIVRDAKTRDQCNAVRMYVFAQEFNRDPTEEFDGNDFGAFHFFGRNSDGTVVATVRARPFGENVFVERLCILPDYRSFQSANKLLDYME